MKCGSLHHVKETIISALRMQMFHWEICVWWKIHIPLQKSFKSTTWPDIPQAHHEYKRLQKQLVHKKLAWEWVYARSRWSLFLDAFCLNVEGKHEDGETRRAVLSYPVPGFTGKHFKEREWNVERHGDPPNARCLGYTTSKHRILEAN